MKEFALVVLLLPLFACDALKEQPVTEKELQMIVTVPELTAAGVTELDARAQKIDRAHEMDGSMRLTCTYETDSLFFESEARFFSTNTEAEREFKETIVGYRKAAEEVKGRYPNVKPELLRIGDENYAALLQEGKAITGNVFIVRKGRVVHSFAMTGSYFDDPESIRSLLAPQVDAADAWVKSSGS